MSIETVGKALLIDAVSGGFGVVVAAGCAAYDMPSFVGAGVGALAAFVVSRVCRYELSFEPEVQKQVLECDRVNELARKELARQAAEREAQDRAAKAAKEQARRDKISAKMKERWAVIKEAEAKKPSAAEYERRAKISASMKRLHAQRKALKEGRLLKVVGAE